MYSPHPNREDFIQKWQAKQSQLLWLSVPADLETTVSTYLKLTHDRPMSYMLESVEGGVSRGRYSFIGHAPDLIWRYKGDKVEINKNALNDLNDFQPVENADILNSIIGEIDAIRMDIPDHLPPMSSVLAGYFSYDSIRLFENIPDNNSDDLNLPDGIFMRPTLVAVFDNILDTLTFVVPIWFDDNLSFDKASALYDKGVERLMAARDTLNKPAPILQRASKRQEIYKNGDVNISSNIDEQDFNDMVKKAKDYIAAGDIFQVVLSQRFCIDNFTLPPFDFYRALRHTNPSPYMFYLNFGDFQIAGSSPEILVKLEGDEVTIRPIAGTRKRGADKEQDEALEHELLHDEKELAEHLMLLDLGRNDVGRVSEIGSINVGDKFFIERYSHVMHIVSNVTGKLRKGLRSIDALMAGFPAGTVSGAPKIRAMQIIDELEQTRRGVYAGCIGYFSANGDMNTCIALRTAVLKDNKIYIQAGAGIVADSVDVLENQECQNKAAAAINAAMKAVEYQRMN